VRGLTVIIATGGIFVWRAVTHKRVHALPTMPRHGVNTVDAPLQERGKSRKKINRVYLRDRKPPQNGYSTESGHKWIFDHSTAPHGSTQSVISSYRIVKSFTITRIAAGISFKGAEYVA